jgi:hypothetical protein
MMCGFPAAYFSIKAFSETDFTQDVLFELPDPIHRVIARKTVTFTLPSLKRRK